jgi:hypothetical protein
MGILVKIFSHHTTLTSYNPFRGHYMYNTFCSLTSMRMTRLGGAAAFAWEILRRKD